MQVPSRFVIVSYRFIPKSLEQYRFVEVPIAAVGSRKIEARDGEKT